jgi:hypothetical protein
MPAAVQSVPFKPKNSVPQPQRDLALVANARELAKTREGVFMASPAETSRDQGKGCCATPE